MIILSILLMEVYSIPQINLMEGQQYSQRLNQILEINGLQTIINQPSLGFEIQGGISGGVINSFANQTIVSFTQFDIIYLALLYLENNTYGASILKLEENTTYVLQAQIANISNTQKCQGIGASSLQFLAIPCFATNGQVTMYIWNEQLIQFQTNLTIKVSQLQQMSLYVNEQDGEYSISLCIQNTNSTIIYNMIYKDQNLSQPQQIWQQSGQFVQVYVSNQNQVFALSSQQLFITNQNITKIYSIDKQRYMSFSLSQYDDNVIYVLTNTSIITLLYNLGINQTIALPQSISNGSIFTSYKLLYVCTQNKTLTYQYINNKYLKYQQFYNIGFNQQFTQVSPLNFIITSNNNIIQIFLQLDFYIYNSQPNYSGMFNVSQYFMNGTLFSNQSIYANVINNYTGQILPKQYQYNGSQLIYDSRPQIKLNLALFDGPILQYGVNSSFISGVQGNQISNLQVMRSQIFTNYPLKNADGYLQLLIDDQVLYIYIQSMQEEVGYDSVFSNTYNLTNTIESIKVIEFNNLTQLVLLISNDSIFVYYIQPLVYTQYCYQLNLTESYNISSINPSNTLVINQNILLQYNSTQYIIQMGLYNFTLISQQQINLSSLSFITLVDYSLLFYLNDNKIMVNLLQTKNNKMIQLTDKTLPLQGLITLIIPLEECIIGLETSNNVTQLYYFENDMQGIFYNQSYYYEIISYNLTFQPSQMAYSNKLFYIWVQNGTKNYINFYSCTSQINQPVQQLTVVGEVSYISAYSNIPYSYDILNYQVKSIGYVVYYPYNIQLTIFPIFALTLQLQVDIPLIIVNWNYTESVYLNITINQMFLDLHNYNTSLSITLYEEDQVGSLQINPYNMFNGSIQNYIIKCQDCNSFNYTNILSQGYIYFQKNTATCNYYIQNNTQILYIVSNSEIYQYNASVNNTFPTTPLLENYTLVYKTDGNPYDVVLMTFLEINTNSLSWLYANNSELYVVSMINGTPTYLFINYGTDSTFGIYNEGFLQMSYNQSYYCYFYSIINNTQNLIIISNGIEIPGAQIFGSPFINYQSTPSYIVFGTLLQNSIAGVYGILLNVSLALQTQYTLISYKMFNLYEILPKQDLLDANQIQQLNQPYIEGHLTVIELVYTTLASAGRIALFFDRMALVDYKQYCTLNLINATIIQLFYNQISVNQNQVAIINSASSKTETQILLSLYKIDDSVCYGNNIVQPYLVEILDSQLSSEGFTQVQYLSSNLLLISYGLNTTIYQVQQDILIQYNASTNSYINITAFNPIYNSSQLIYLDYDQSQKHKLAWYWITLIVILSLIIVVGFSLLIHFKCRSNKSDFDSHLIQKNEIEIK